MPTSTTNYSFNKPLVNNAIDEDLWGSQLNDNWDSVDTVLGARTASKFGAVIVQNTTDDGFDTITSQGTSGQVLTSAGADALPTFSDAGTLVLLETQTASGSANISFDNTVLTTTHKKYIFEFIDVVMASDGVNMHMIVSEDNGSSYKTTNEYNFSAVDTISSSATAISTPGVATANIVISPVSLIGNSTGESFSGSVAAYNPLGTALHKRFLIDTGCQDNGGATANRRATGDYIGSVNAVNNIRFLSNSGNITSGEFKIYGVR